MVLFFPTSVSTSSELQTSPASAKTISKLPLNPTLTDTILISAEALEASSSQGTTTTDSTRMMSTEDHSVSAMPNQETDVILISTAGLEASFSKGTTMTYVRMTTEHLSASAMPDQTPIVYPVNTEGVMEGSDGSRGISSPLSNVAFWVWVILALVVIAIISCCIIISTVIACCFSRNRKKKACYLSKLFEVVPPRENIKQTSKKDTVAVPESVQLGMDAQTGISRGISQRTVTTFKLPEIDESVLVYKNNNVVGSADFSVPAGFSSGSQGHTTLEHAITYPTSNAFNDTIFGVGIDNAVGNGNKK